MNMDPGIKTESTALIGDAGRSAKQKKQRWRLFLLMTVIVITYISLGISLYLMNQWIQYIVQKQIFQGRVLNLTAPCLQTNTNDTDYVKFKEVEQTTASWQMYNNVAVPIPGLLATLILPSYSDTFGRRFLFIVPLTALALKCAVLTLIMYFEWGIIWLVVVSAAEGLSGSLSTLNSGAFSYIADITQPNRSRTLGITILEGIMLICITLSGLAAGYLIEFEGFMIPMLGCTIGVSISWIIAVFFLPETHEKQNRANKTSLCANIKRMAVLYTSDNFLKKRSAYIILLVTYFFTELTNAQRASLEMLYQLGQPFCWPSEKIGLFSAARHATQGIAGAVLIAPLKRCLSDVSIATWSALFNAGSYVLEAFANSDLIMYLVPIPATFSFLAVPVVKSIMSSMTDIDKQGSLFASIVLVQNIASIAASFLFNVIYANTVSVFHGFVFLVLAGFSVLVFLFLILFAVNRRTSWKTSSLLAEKLLTNG